MSRKQQVIRITAFLLIFVILFLGIQARFTYTRPQNRGWLDEMYGLEDQTVQAVFLGTSHVYQGITPQEIYEKHHIVTYNMGSSAQKISASYHLLVELLKTQTPKVVVLDASSMLKNEEETSFQYILNVMPLSVNKLSLAYSLMKVQENKSEDAEKDDEEEKNAFGSQNQFETFFGAMVPMYNYHQRWKELSEIDFTKLSENDLYTKGYYENIGYREDGYNVEDVNQEVADARELSEELFTVGIPPQNQRYLLEMKRLCDEKGIHLLVTKVPVVTSPFEYTGAWPQMKYLQIKGFCSEYGIDYLDLVYDVNIGIDTHYDYYDEGHMNRNGASKVSDYLGKYLKETYQLEETYNEEYEKDLEIYHAVQYMADPNLTYDVEEYFDWLHQNKEKQVIFVIGKNDITKNLGEKEMEMYEKLGLSLINEEIAQQSYLGIIDSGKVVHEEASPDAIEGKYKVGEYHFALKSQGTWCGKDAVCTFEGENYCRQGNGLNIVVFDKASGLVIDSCYVDTDAEGEHTLVHKRKLDFSQYVSYVIENKSTKRG